MFTYGFVGDEDDLTTRLHDLTGGAGVNVIFDPVAGPQLATTVIVFGALVS